MPERDGAAAAALDAGTDEADCAARTPLAATAELDATAVVGFEEEVNGELSPAICPSALDNNDFSGSDLAFLCASGTCGAFAFATA